MWSEPGWIMQDIVAADIRHWPRRLSAYFKAGAGHFEQSF